MLPIYCIKLVVRPLILCACSQVLSRNLFASVESQRRWYVSRDLVSPYYQGHVLFWEELELSTVVTLESGSCYCSFCQTVADTVELLNKAQLLPLKKFVHVAINVEIFEVTGEQLLDSA